MIFEKLSSDEITMIDAYRYAFGSNRNASGDHSPDTFCNARHFLREWERRKEDLFHLLGDNLILQKYLAYEKSYEELEEEIDSLLYDRSFGRVGRSGRQFYSEYRNLINSTVDANKYHFEHLISDECLISNQYDGVNFDVPMENGKYFHVVKGCKVSKALGKIASIYNLKGFEDFRICHSQILNQKHLGGNLTLSIHPLDYMTMSDNDCGWDTCMSWQAEGSYKQGTIEMMNSAYVVVAYLSSANEMIMPGHPSQDGESLMWNNKKWRQLFVVSEKGIFAIKDYPYHNDSLSKMIMEWIIELAETNLKWEYFPIQSYGFKDEDVFYNGLTFRINLYTEMMYNDTGSLDYHWIAIGKNISQDDLQQCWQDRQELEVSYSGYSECVMCGLLDPSLDDESCLTCTDCEDTIRCEICGESIKGSVIIIDGMTICNYCYEDKVFNCANCDEVYIDSEMLGLYILPRYNENENYKLSQPYIQSIPYNDTILENELQQQEYLPNLNSLADYNSMFLFCSKHCLDDWEKRALLKGHSVHFRQFKYDRVWAVYFDELTEETQNKICPDANNDPEAFKRMFSFCTHGPTQRIER